MRIGLISDTHLPEAHPELWPQVFHAFEGVEFILHGGDIHELWVIDQLERVAPIYVARGNGEDGSAGRDVQPQDPRLKEAWLIEAGGVHIGLTHYVPMPQMPPQLTVDRWVKKLFPEQRPDVLGIPILAIGAVWTRLALPRRRARLRIGRGARDYCVCPRAPGCIKPSGMRGKGRRGMSVAQTSP